MQVTADYEAKIASVSPWFTVFLWGFFGGGGGGRGVEGAVICIDF